MGTSDAPTNGWRAGACLLVADDDPGVLTMFATLLRATAGVTSVVEAKDGAAAVGPLLLLEAGECLFFSGRQPDMMAEPLS